MKMAKRRVLILIATVLVAVSVFGVLASAATNVVYDASVTGSKGNVYLSTSDILEKYLDEELTASERAFFDTVKQSGVLETVEIAYNEIINTNKAEVEYSEGSLYVKAYKYEYIGAGDNSFVWIPESVTVGDETIPLVKSGDVYVAEIDCEEPKVDEELLFNYRADVEISESDLSAVLNLYRNSAEYIYNKTEYDAYVIEKKIYDGAKAKYDKYVSEKQEYDALRFEYDNYGNVLAQYEADLLKYQEYENAKKDYPDKLAAYNEYMLKYSKIEKQLNGVKLIDVPMTMDRTVYAAVMGGTVDQVLENESAIVAAGADKDAVRLAGEATERVRSLMNGFKACATDAEKYAYYSSNYKNFCDSFLLLTQTLDALYTRAVRAFLITNDKNEKYVILVAQLALITNALIDGEVKDYYGKVAYTSGWTFDGKTISQILENKNYFTDDDTATPVPLPAAVEKPEEPVEVEKPTYPKQPQEPIEPTAVQDPGDAPAIVNNPDESLKQNEILKIYKGVGGEYKNILYNAAKGGELPEERSLTENVLTFVTQVKKTYLANTVKVTFESRDGDVLSVLDVDAKSPVVCEQKIPKSYVDVLGETRVFVGWGVKIESDNVDNVSVELECGFDKDVVLEPLYEKYCNIVWDIDGEIYTKLISVLEAPVCPIVPMREDNGDMYYEFIGWLDEFGVLIGKDIPKLDRDAKYTAAFERKYIVEYQAVAGSGSFGAQITYEEDNVVCDATNNPKNTHIDISKLIDRVVENQSSLTIKTKKGIINFTFSDVLQLNDKGVKSVKIDSSGNSTLDNYKVTLCDNDGNFIYQTVEVTVKTQAADTSKYKLYKCPENEAMSYVRYSANGDSITFEAETGVKYLFKAEYSINLFGSKELVDFDISSTVAGKQDIISYSITPKPGVEILEITVEDVAGNKLALYDNNLNLIDTEKVKNVENAKFQIGTNDVNITVNARHVTYSVSFNVNGTVINQQKLLYNATVTLPTDTATAVGDDGVYTYKFLGWDTDGDGVADEINPVTKDVEYVAVYEKTLIPPKEDTGGLKLSAKVKKLFYIAVAAFFVFLIVMILFIRFIRKKLRRRKARKAGFVTYKEYKASKQLKKAEKRYKKASDDLDDASKSLGKTYKKFEKANKSCQKAKQKLKNAINERVAKESKKAHKKAK